jgi:hypothetical protein
VVVKTEEPVNEQVVDTTTAAATQEGPADEAPKVEESKAEKPATKPAAKAAEPAKKPTKK